MTLPSVCKPIAILGIACLSVFARAQSPTPAEREKKPYKVLTSGKQITIKATKEMASVMVWTASGHRIVEQKEVNATSFSFNVNVSEKVFFLMIRFEGMKPYTEKIGI